MKWSPFSKEQKKEIPRMPSSDYPLLTDLIINFGINMKYLRKKANLTQDQLATKIGYCENYLGRIEASKRIRPSLRFIHGIAREFNCTFHELFYTRMEEE